LGNYGNLSVSITSWCEDLNFSVWPNKFAGTRTPSKMRGKTMVVMGFLRGDLGTVYLSFHYGGWLEVPAFIVRSSTYSYVHLVRSFIDPSCGCSDVVICDLFGTTISSLFGVVPLTLRASIEFSDCTWFPASSSCWPCPSSGISMSMPTSFVCWVCSTMGVGIPGVVSYDENSSTLTTSGG
jgi:hypothetical protein